MIRASNRQFKVLRFFAVPFGQSLSAEEARHEVAGLLEHAQNKLRWDQYVYLTGDLDSSSAEPKIFDAKELSGVVVPEGWTATKAEKEYREKTAARILDARSVWDEPEPIVVFQDRAFLFTGRFDLGTRDFCERLVRERGGLVPESDYVLHTINYLVVGNQGSSLWKRGTYGSKIEAAVVEREIHGTPAIITERYWKSCL